MTSHVQVGNFDLREQDINYGLEMSPNKRLLKRLKKCINAKDGYDILSLRSKRFRAA